MRMSRLALVAIALWGSTQASAKDRYAPLDAILETQARDLTIGQLAQQGSQLNTLRFSRSQEYDADRLGISYLARSGYDPAASARFRPLTAWCTAWARWLAW